MTQNDLLKLFFLAGSTFAVSSKKGKKKVKNEFTSVVKIREGIIITMFVLSHLSLVNIRRLGYEPNRYIRNYLTDDKKYVGLFVMSHKNDYIKIIQNIASI